MPTMTMGTVDLSLSISEWSKESEVSERWGEGEAAGDSGGETVGRAIKVSDSSRDSKGVELPCLDRERGRTQAVAELPPGFATRGDAPRGGGRKR